MRNFNPIYYHLYLSVVGNKKLFSLDFSLFVGIAYIVVYIVYYLEILTNYPIIMEKYFNYPNVR